MDVSLEQLVKENEWIEKEIFQSGSVENSIWVSNSPRRDLITRWAANLEKLHDLGKYDADVNTISSHISAKLRRAGMISAIHYVSETLEYKYKNPNISISDEDELSVENPQEISSLRNAEEVNRLYISFLDRTIEELSKIKSRLTEDIILEPMMDQNEADQFYVTWDHFIIRAREAWDGREKVLTSHQFIMGWCLSEYSLNHAYHKYQKYIKENIDRMASFTPKQAGKLERGHVKRLQDIFNPDTFVQALDLGFYGQQCENCGSWRTIKKYNSDKSIEEFQLFCFGEHDKYMSQWTTLKKMKLREVVING